jgi:uncharacterized protein (DUF1684 family)
MRNVKYRLLSLLVIASACTSGPQPIEDGSHEREVMAWRADKDVMFKSSGDSPLLPADRATFTSLPYFPFDLAYRMPARLTPESADTPHFIELSTSATEMRRMRRVGTLGFAVKGQALRLTAFADENDTAMTRLFVPFGDLTNKTETYGGGRYIELTRTSTSLYDLDFNRAYHPYCVYNTTYVCPVPPNENRLDARIAAGERLGGPKAQ